MKKETRIKLQKYNENLIDAVKLGTKCNTALKALKEIPLPTPILKDAIKELEYAVEHYGKVYSNSVHNIAVIESKEGI